MCVVTFNPATFLVRYPVFANVPTPQLQAYFIEAGLYLNNTDASPVCDCTIRATLLNMLVAHISFMNGDLTADGQARPVGQVTAANEGSVGATFGIVTPTPGTGAWFQQSQYGAAFWQATANLRGMRYRAPARRVGYGYPYGRF